ncbi:hypothetical protein RSAG8_07299, partial [Rhizoctonia solani AG-8 WAC10335]
MHVATQDMGQALSEARTLGEFLEVMHDACVVQCNLYCKSKILHHDISNNNIMIAPKDDKRFYKCCDGGYDKVKYLIQVGWHQLIKEVQTCLPENGHPQVYISVCFPGQTFGTLPTHTQGGGFAKVSTGLHPVFANMWSPRAEVDQIWEWM